MSIEERGRNREMTPIDLDKIKEAAGKATPGPWFVAGAPWLPSDVETYVLAYNPDPHAGEMVCDMPTADMAGVEDRYEDDEWSARNDANAAHIAAADPATVLKLVAVVEAARRARIELAALIPNPKSPSLEDWPVQNPADAECLNNAYAFLTEALHPFSHINGEQP